MLFVATKPVKALGHSLQNMAWRHQPSSDYFENDMSLFAGKPVLQNKRS